MPNHQETEVNYMSLIVEMAEDASDVNVFQKLARKNRRQIIKNADKDGTPCNCPCPHNLEDHLQNIISYRDFAIHIYHLAKLSKKYPDLALNWLNGSCAYLSNEDWVEREAQRQEVG